MDHFSSHRLLIKFICKWVLKLKYATIGLYSNRFDQQEEGTD